ncbi:MAG: type IV pilus twitching motility protein PilT [Candidatus Krumholzibacteria bacterium]|nr:type IV pilus twitching motility protein PilT [Candidatus Krumholzibacteria bacterium]MDH4336607.1 type IV pilus twitching motility protein PilT [Candidatus Krumholzibacteria bacterium]MDH5268950.1 type IV pilus twitching motility protein PilT [Candidatus Krumholzibacteria bacterium]
MINLRDLLQEMIEAGASDLHLTAGLPPMIRVDGNVRPTDREPLSPEQVQSLAYSVLNEEQQKRFEAAKELDFSFGVKGMSRFRGNAYLQRGCVGLAIRQIPYEIRTFRDLGLPTVMEKLSKKQQGLILVTGPTGSGKSTTLASIIDKVNTERPAHIVTIEDPVEYIHQHKKCIVNQREVKADTESFGNALKHVLRQDPDVILIGEMRDQETMQAALTIAETGHLTLATLHTNSTFESINRIVDTFPPSQQNQVRAQLAFVLEGVLAQQLVPRMRGKGRVLVTEVMVCTPAIRAVIRDDKVHQIYGLMQAGQKHGMQTMNQALFNAVMGKEIDMEEALRRSSDPQELTQMVGGPVGVR